MPRNSQTTFDSLAQASAALNVPVAEIRRAKVRGCLAFRSGRIYSAPLKAWLRANPLPRQPRTPARATTPAPTPADEIGAQFSLKRLEAAELSAWQTLQDALAVGDTVSANEARRAWLLTSDHLRKSDIAIEQSRRIIGELVQRSEVETGLRSLLSAIIVSGRTAAHAHSGELAGASCAEASDILDRCWLGGIVSGVAALAEINPRIPKWMTASCVAALNLPLKDAEGLVLERCRQFYLDNNLPVPARLNRDESTRA